MYSRLFERKSEQTADTRVVDGSIRVRSFANDDIYFFVKRIDNAGVVRESDPEARGTCWKLIGSVVAAVVLLVAVLLPGAYSLLAGYQIQSLREEGQRLATEQASLELQEAQLIHAGADGAVGARAAVYRSAVAEGGLSGHQGRVGGDEPRDRNLVRNGRFEKVLPCRRISPHAVYISCYGSCSDGRESFSGDWCGCRSLITTI